MTLNALSGCLDTYGAFGNHYDGYLIAFQLTL